MVWREVNSVGLMEVWSKFIDPVPFQYKIRDKTATFLSRSKSRPDPAIPAGFRPERPGSVPGVPFRVQNKKKRKKKEKLLPLLSLLPRVGR